MTRLLALSLVALAAGSASAQPPRRAAVHEPFTPPITATKIRTAIDDAVYYLRTQQGQDGSVGGDEGQTSLAALTLLAAGADPAADDGLKKMLGWLGARK